MPALVQDAQALLPGLEVGQTTQGLNLRLGLHLKLHSYPSPMSPPESCPTKTLAHSSSSQRLLPRSPTQDTGSEDVSTQHPRFKPPQHPHSTSYSPPDGRQEGGPAASSDSGFLAAHTLSRVSVPANASDLFFEA